MALRRLFWLALIGLVNVVGAKVTGQSLESSIGALLIIGVAMFPSYLWVYGKVRGLPLFPVCALTCIWTFGLPLVSEHRIVTLFPGWNQLVASLTIVGFLLTGTLTWYLTSRRQPRPAPVCWMISEARCEPLMLIALAFCAVWTVISNAGWLLLPSGVDSLFRALLVALQALTCFVMGYRLGARRLSTSSKTAFIVLLSILLVATLASLLLIIAMSLVATSVLAYVIASKRLPWRVGLAALCVFGLLHVGKAAMREKYWDEEDQKRAVSPFHYPEFFAEWVQTSVKIIRQGDSSDEAGESLLERSSLMQWLLYFQANTPNAVPYMNGATYAVIPRLFIPRILDPDKPRSQEASYLLAIHYGIQTREDTEVTTFAFGLINEAYANFGFLGVSALGALLGVFYGKVAQWARGMPILSFWGLFAILIASFTFQAEFTSTFYVAALFQSTVVLALISLVFMRPMPLSAARGNCFE